ncbi:hypothetical protein P3X46_010934 [Hevea brasiliensis]|uniref:PdxS/SNZ N-terminal domain-containing protein n=1 Tax=Hevea brasiliensis TaxID=3981 RepID=A0ABQ9MG09_HEVBR|nr:uncharacterized protein LOC110631994 [Hevea brasiliensis]KAJ9179111.1 hypothetical protein P3X46_010934 [Hevea brasiliensis]
MSDIEIDVPIGDSFSDNYGEENLLSAKVGFAQLMLLSGGRVIVEVTNAEEAKIAEEGGAACCVVHQGKRMPDLSIVRKIKQAVSIPVMVRIRVGHFVEAWILEAIGVDYIDESELMGYAANNNYISKQYFRVPFGCRCKNLKEALARIKEGAAIIWIHGEEGSSLGGTVENVKSIMQTTSNLKHCNEDEVSTFAKEMDASDDLVAQIRDMGKLPVVQIAMGGVETPADAALMMHLGCDGVCIRSEIFEFEHAYSWNPSKRLPAIVKAVNHYNNPRVLAECSNTEEADDDTDDLV